MQQSRAPVLGGTDESTCDLVHKKYISDYKKTWKLLFFLTFIGWVMSTLWKKDTTMETNQLMERSFPNFKP